MPPKTLASHDAPPDDVLARKAEWACDTLDAEYGTLQWRSHADPLSTLVMTILSQHTSDKNSERAFDNLRRTYPDWETVRNAPAPDIADAIRSGGLADSKAPRIKNVLEQIHAKKGKLTLDFLRDLPTSEAKEYLTGFHGVGPKTMACVMMFSLCRPVLPVDTHVFRVSHRLGLIEKRIGEARAHAALEALVPPARVYAFHVHMIRHGRRVCVAQKPRCGACVLQDRCDYFQNDPFEPINTPLAKRTQTNTLHGLPVAQTAPKSSNNGYVWPGEIV